MPIFHVWRVTVYPKKYAHGFVVLCFVVVMQSFIMNSHEVFIHIHQGCFAGTGAIVRLPQCQWSKPDGYGKISQCITTTKHSKAKTVCILLGIYCTLLKNENVKIIFWVISVATRWCLWYVSELCQHWFRQWLAACSAPSHHLNQSWLTVNCTLGNTFQWNVNSKTNRRLDDVCSKIIAIFKSSMCW